MYDLLWTVFVLVFFPLLVNWTGYLDTVTLSSVVRESGDLRVNGEVKSSKSMLIKTRYPNLFHAYDFLCFNLMNY